MKLSHYILPLFSCLLSFITTLSFAQSFSQVAEIGPSSAHVSWQGCNDNNEAIRYRKAGVTEWTMVFTGSTPACKLSNLRPKTSYEYEVKTSVVNGIETWSATEKLLTIGRPNLLVILADDGRYDNYTVNGGPAFFQSPNINSIATEGANFKYCFPALSLCSPSRASIVTGTYPHHHGVVGNAVIDTLLLPTVAEILHDSGYYTGLVGKYGFDKWPIAGYDYWLQSASDPYSNVPYDTPTGTVFIPGHKTTVFTNGAKDFLSSVPDDTPFCLFLFHKAPHVPLDPRPDDTMLYLTETMPFPEDFFPYTQNYPSYLYDCHSFINNADTLAYEWLKYYQLLAGIDWSVGAVLTKLENQGKLDSTLIIYTSDNGLLKGEHLLRGKQIPQDESLRLPMFIRYPTWYAPNTKIENEMVMNIDIAPTLLDAAGINNPAKMDGWSIHDITSGLKHRKEFLYEFFNKEECTPTIHAVRSFDYKYVFNSCENVTEEFYDLTIDSLETINWINVPSYQPLIQTYRQKLDSLRKFYGDTILVDTVLNCELVNPNLVEQDEPESGKLYATVYPNPGHEQITISWSYVYSQETEITISDITGRNIYYNSFRNASNRNANVDSKEWPAGMYMISLKSGEQEKVLKYLKE
ncbi:MAG TPA: sulfatase-like hydrolase/transferase [Chitinophagales bacterium]|nr:sulfatase-like hydrolase/transferase [Chitinophagales bacterium]